MRKGMKGLILGPSLLLIVAFLPCYTFHVCFFCFLMILLFSWFKPRWHGLHLLDCATVPRWVDDALLLMTHKIPLCIFSKHDMEGVFSVPFSLSSSSRALRSYSRLRE